MYDSPSTEAIARSRVENSLDTLFRNRNKQKLAVPVFLIRGLIRECQQDYARLKAFARSPKSRPGSRADFLRPRST